MRNCKRLVQIQVAHICANPSGLAYAHLGIHVGAVHVHLGAVFVRHTTNFADAFFKYSVR